MSTVPTAATLWTRVAAYAVCRAADGAVLLTRLGPADRDHGWWTLPGGALEFGEDPAAGALRELTEETGLDGEIEALIGIQSRHIAADASRSGREVHSIRIVYRVRIVGGELRDEVDGSSDRAAWIAPDELPALQVVELVPFALAL